MLSSRVLPVLRSSATRRAFSSLVARTDRFLPSQCVFDARVAVVIPHQQVRGMQVHVHGPFDPPKQLTFKEVETRVLKAIRAWDRFPAEKSSQLTLDSAFSDLGFDSLDKVEIIMALEDEFNFEIPDADADKLKTPRDVFKYVCEREDVYE